MDNTCDMDHGASLFQDRGNDAVRTTKRRKGHLSFKSNFESGNLSKVRVIQDGLEYELYIRPDSNNPAYRLWFYFSVHNVRKYQRVLLTVVNFSKSRSLYREGMTPLVKSTSRPQFERIPERQVFYYRCPKHQRSYVLSFLFTFDKEEDVYYFAYCYPYTYTDLQKYLYHIEARNFPFFQRETIGWSVQNRRIDLLTITDPNNVIEGTTRPRRQTIFISARVHPGETPSSYICHGIISFLLSDHPGAKRLRNHLIFKILPMINPDGVFLGNYRCSAMGFDLNRQYLNPDNWAHPETVATRDCLLRLKNDPDVDFDMFIDIHSHSTAHSSFMFVNHAENYVQREKALLYPRLLDSRAKEFSFNDTKCCRNPSKLGTGRRALGELLQVARHCYTLEVSFYSYVDTNSKLVPFTESNYLELGKKMCLTFLDYYDLLPVQKTGPKKTSLTSVVEATLRETEQSENIR